MYEIIEDWIHGESFAIRFQDIEFLTWRQNEETGDYWVKMHVRASGKEIRIKVDETNLRIIADCWASCHSDTGEIINLKLKLEDDLDGLGY